MLPSSSTKNADEPAKSPRSHRTKTGHNLISSDVPRAKTQESAPFLRASDSSDAHKPLKQRYLHILRHFTSKDKNSVILLKTRIIAQEAMKKMRRNNMTQFRTNANKKRSLRDNTTPQNIKTRWIRMQHSSQRDKDFTNKIDTRLTNLTLRIKCPNFRRIRSLKKCTAVIQATHTAKTNFTFFHNLKN